MILTYVIQNVSGEFQPFVRGTEALLNGLGFDYTFFDVEAVFEHWQVKPVAEWKRNYSELFDGLYVVYRHFEPVALYYSESERVEWIDEEYPTDFILESLMLHINPPLAKLSEPIPSTYKVMNPENLSTFEGLYKGEPVKVKIIYIALGKSTPLDERTGDKPYYINNHNHADTAGKIVVETSHGDRYTIHISEFDIPINVEI